MSRSVLRISCLGRTGLLKPTAAPEGANSLDGGVAAEFTFRMSPTLPSHQGHERREGGRANDGRGANHQLCVNPAVADTRCCHLASACRRLPGTKRQAPHHYLAVVCVLDTIILPWCVCLCITVRCNVNSIDRRKLWTSDPPPEALCHTIPRCCSAPQLPFRPRMSLSRAFRILSR